jgi:hypothetical protein
VRVEQIEGTTRRTARSRQRCTTDTEIWSNNSLSLSLSP